MKNINIENEKKYYFGFSLIPGVGAKTMEKVIHYFGNAEQAWRANISDIEKLGLNKKIKKSIIENRKKIDLEEKWSILSNNGVSLIIYPEDSYPTILKEIYDSPMLLFYKGDLNWNDCIFFGVVGTRKLTSYGRRAIEEIISQLTLQGITIVSGMARGGDSVAHKVAIDSGGKTVAVLGSGFDHLYPPENKKLAQEIIENGALLSEFPPHIEPRRQHFPMRNRIISGLSLGVLVVEASEKSGTLITANCALEQNREVFALPGSIFSPYSKGPAKLIKMGAKLVSSVEDILEELNIQSRLKSKKARQIIPSSPEEEKILGVLNLDDYVMIDQLVRVTGLSSSQILSTITMMEMKGLIRNLGGGKYSKV